jgi:uncharacterized protein YbjQ (UPF0145 family)
MHISATDAIEGRRVLHRIGKIKAASAWHADNHAPLDHDRREQILRDLIRKAEEFDADGIIDIGYEPDSVGPVDETKVRLTRWVATGIAVKLSCAAA